MDQFDEYKLVSERTQRMSERRQEASQTYLGGMLIMAAMRWM